MTPLQLDHLSAIDLATAFDAPPPPLDFIWPRFLTGTVGALIATGGVGKSYWALEASMAVACGIAGGDLLGITPSRAGRVAYLALEDPEPVLVQRIHAIGQHFSQPVRQTIATNLMLVPALGSRIDLMNSSHSTSLIRRCTGYRLIVLDTLSRIHRCNESSNDEMAQLISSLEHIAVSTGAAVLFLHHVAKASAHDGRSQQHAARGASALMDNSRWCSHMDRENSRIRFSESKHNYGITPPERWYERQSGGVLVPTREQTSTVSPIRRKPRAQA